MVNWASSRDPILQRYGVGGVARAAISSNAGFAAVQDAGGLKALVSALSEDDPQAQCFAAAALGEQFCCFSLECVGTFQASVHCQAPTEISMRCCSGSCIARCATCHKAG